jgi:hypothetical protein
VDLTSAPPLCLHGVGRDYFTLLYFTLLYFILLYFSVHDAIDTEVCIASNDAVNYKRRIGKNWEVNGRILVELTRIARDPTDIGTRRSQNTSLTARHRHATFSVT